MFSPTNLFKGIICPQDEQCKLVNCIFEHAAHSSRSEPSSLTSQSVKTASQATSEQPGVEERPAKRRKISYDKLEDKPLSRAEQIKAQLAADRDGQAQTRATAQPKPMASLQRPVTPPSLSSVAAPTPQEHTAAKSEPSDPQSPWQELKKKSKSSTESLNPRVINPAPDSHAKRVVYLQHIHSNMSKLNRSLKESRESIAGMDLQSMQSFELSDQELKMLALAEEENIGRKQTKVYPNAIRHCIAGYQKMALSAWLMKLKAMTNTDQQNTMTNVFAKEKIISKGLPVGQEHLILPHLVVRNQASLKDYGYISKPPSREQAAEAAVANTSNGNYETCDRCGSRFRVFPDRDPETGRLTTNGPCRYHWARKIFPSKQKTDSYTGSNDAIYPCCGQSLGTEGCTKHEDHVYKVSSAARLAAVMPFIDTPAVVSQRLGDDGKPVHAVVFDCEMGYTTNGMELIRLSAVSWPSGQSLLDVLVRPLGTVIDLNTRFSGVTAEHMTAATPYIESGPVISQPGMMIIVDQPAMARQLLCSFLRPDTPLMGHAIDNDLNATRLCHPTIVDTVLLYSHPRGLPFRYGLKMLSKKYLNRNIQMGGSAGHDSREDAIATGDIIEVKAADVWEDLLSRGWKLQHEALVRPASDSSEVGWQLSAKSTAKPKPALNNGLAKLLDEARSEPAQANELASSNAFQN